MIGENLSYYKSKLKHAEKSGPQWVTIERLTLPFDGGYTVKFKNDNIEHEEFYSIKQNFSDFLKLLKILKSKDDIMEIVGKQLWIVIRHNITMNGDVEVKREAEIVHYSADEKMPNYPSVFEEYDIAAK